jgi:IS4 transposase
MRGDKILTDFTAWLCTDLEMEESQILAYYARRWSIEVFFKDAKQMLYMAKEQSNTFDALVACHSLVMIRYLL